MRTISNSLTVKILVIVVCLFSSCTKVREVFPFDGSHGNKGNVYTMSNDTGVNSILMYRQDLNGKLNYAGQVNSGGKGLGRGLGSQGPLIVDKENRLLFTVNAGDNTISSFRISGDGSLKLLATVPSGGVMPISLTVFKSLLYVVNNSGNICGFKIEGNGLSMIPGSMQPLSTGDAGPGEILFQPDGSHVVVTEKATHRICTFKISSSGAAESAVINPAHAETPFGFAFAGDNQLIITNAYGGRMGQSVITSLSLGANGATSLSGAVPTQQTSACWVTLTKDQEYAFATNAVSATISSLRVGGKNRLELVDATVAKTGASPTEIILSANGDYIYNLNANSHSITGFEILPKGRLLDAGAVSGLPLAAAGLAAY